MPVNNPGEFLQAAVDSVLEQTHQKLELLLIDDHSDDGAIEHLLSSVTDQRLKVLTSNGTGIVDALNHGIEYASNEIIARMDGDDICHPNRLANQLAYKCLYPEVNIVGAKVELFKRESEIQGGYLCYENWINRLTSHDQIEREFFIESAIPHPTALFTRKDFEALGGYKNSSWPEDYDLWCRALLADMRFGKPETQTMLYWRDHSSRTSRVDKRYSDIEFLKCKAYYLAKYLKIKKNINDVYIWGAGPTGQKLHDLLLANDIQINGFIDINQRLIGRFKKNLPITVVQPSSLKYTEMIKASLSDSYCVVAVASRGAREKIRDFLLDLDLDEGTNFIFAA